MDNGRNLELPKFKKAIDLGLMTLGFVLFIVLGVQALQQADSMQVAAGQNKQSATLDASNSLSFLSAAQVQGDETNFISERPEQHKPAAAPHSKQKLNHAAEIKAKQNISINNLPETASQAGVKLPENIKVNL